MTESRAEHVLRAKEVFGILLLSSGLFMILIRFAFLPAKYSVSGPGILFLVAGMIIMLNGILTLTMPAASVGKGKVKMHNPLGMTLRTVSYETLANLRIIDNYLEINEQGNWNRIKWMRGGRFRTDDWNQLRRILKKSSERSRPENVSS